MMKFVVCVVSNLKMTSVFRYINPPCNDEMEREKREKKLISVIRQDFFASDRQTHIVLETIGANVVWVRIMHM